MTDYTFGEVKAALKFVDWTALSEVDDGFKTAVVINDKPVLVEKMASKAGEYDYGDSDIFVVIKVGEQFFKQSGWYYSHSGSNWNDGLTEVRATEKTVTVYEFV
jgi:hypothetical protein